VCCSQPKSIQGPRIFWCVSLKICQFIKYWLNCCAKAVPFFLLSVFPFLMCGDLSLIWSVSLFAVRRFLVCCSKEGSDGLCFAGRTWSHRVGRGLQNPFSWSSRRFLLVINSLHQSSIASAVYLALNWNISIFSFSWLNTTMTENRKILNTSDLDGFDKVSCCGSSMILSLISQLYPRVLVLWSLSSLESLGTVFKSSWELFVWPKCLSFALLIKIRLPPRLKVYKFGDLIGNIKDWENDLASVLYAVFLFLSSKITRVF